MHCFSRTSSNVVAKLVTSSISPPTSTTCAVKSSVKIHLLLGGFVHLTLSGGFGGSGWCRKTSLEIRDKRMLVCCWWIWYIYGSSDLWFSEPIQLTCTTSILPQYKKISMVFKDGGRCRTPDKLWHPDNGSFSRHGKKCFMADDDKSDTAVGAIASRQEDLSFWHPMIVIFFRDAGTLNISTKLAQSSNLRTSRTGRCWLLSDADGSRQACGYPVIFLHLINANLLTYTKLWNTSSGQWTSTSYASISKYSRCTKQSHGSSAPDPKNEFQHSNFITIRGEFWYHFSLLSSGSIKAHSASDFLCAF